MINQVVLVGRLTRDPEVRKSLAGLSCASFTLAVNDSHADRNGDRSVIFMSCSVWGKPADNVAQFIHKGSLVGVSGRLAQRKYTRRTDGSEVTVTEVLANAVEFLDPKPEQTASQASDASPLAVPEDDDDMPF